MCLKGKKADVLAVRHLFLFALVCCVREMRFDASESCE